ncbi:MAG: asparagine synthase (glutamine-hydrolyzing) [Cytophagaceae bacterium]|nr:asparagine synthase (glutamine-hydrolyzing) [Cytophagaceae bacterium]
MCGITGIYAFNQIGSFYMVNLAKATDKLSQRGPDGRGTFLDDFVGLGHRRLSIIDTSSQGSQPMKDESGRYVIVFNGEIFNFKELRKKLADKGVSFTSECDTEVLLKLYIHEGKGCLHQLVGFFAFAIYDKQEKTIFLARDRMGIKPLHYFYDEDKFIFSSEMKSLLAYNIPKEIDYESLYSYLQLNYIPAPYSIFKGIHKLEPGHYLFVKKKKLDTGIYYTIPYDREKVAANDTSYDTHKEKLISLMEESVRLRMVSDVPLGAFLSGGIDSSVVVALASRYTDKLNTFSIGYKDESFFDETSYANLVAKKFGTQHTVFSLTNDDLFDHLFATLDYIDEPFADSSALAVNILSRHTAKHVKVALSGDGGDELFAGYNKHLGELRVREGGFAVNMVTMLAPLWKMLPKSRGAFFANRIRQFHRLAEGNKLSAKDRYWKWCGFANESEVSLLLSEKSKANLRYSEYEFFKGNILKHFTANGDLNEVLRSDMDLVLANDMLVKVDMMSMANGLEVRVPFLDHRVVDFAFSLPVSSKINRKIKKRIVQDSFREILPEELYGRPKHGFEIPLLKWTRRELKSLIQDDLLSDKFIEEQQIFNVKEVKRLKQKLYSSDPGDVHARIWGLLVFNYWHKKYMKN